MTLNHREIVGTVLWWAEGSKTRRDKRWKTAMTYPIEITNTDPEIIQIFLAFLRNDIRVDEARIKVQLQLHSGDNIKQLEQFWSDITKIPKTRFQKTIIRPIGNKVGKSNGTCKVRFADKSVYLRMESNWNYIKQDKLLNDGRSV